MKSNGDETLEKGSKIDPLKFRNVSTSRTFKRTWDQPIKALRIGMNGVAANTIDEYPESTTDGIPESKINIKIIKAKYLLGCDWISYLDKTAIRDTSGRQPNAESLGCNRYNTSD